METSHWILFLRWNPGSTFDPPQFPRKRYGWRGPRLGSLLETCQVRRGGIPLEPWRVRAHRSSWLGPPRCQLLPTLLGETDYSSLTTEKSWYQLILTSLLQDLAGYSFHGICERTPGRSVSSWDPLRAIFAERASPASWRVWNFRILGFFWTRLENRALPHFASSIKGSLLHLTTGRSVGSARDWAFAKLGLCLELSTLPDPVDESETYYCLHCHWLQQHAQRQMLLGAIFSQATAGGEAASD